MLLSVAGARLLVDVHGHGPPLVVLHGGLGWDHTYLRPGLDPLGDRVTLIHYDHRGNGRSSEPDDWDAISHATWVADLEALRAELGHDRILVFGHSYGGVLAQEYALRYPQRLHGLLLCDTAPAPDGLAAAMANAQRRATPDQLAAVVEGFSGPLSSDEQLAGCMRTILPLYFHGDVPETAAGVFGGIRYRVAALNRSIFHCYPRFRTLERLHEIQTPTLVLQGRHDWITPPHLGGERLHAHLPNSDLHVFEQSGHFPFLEEPDAFRGVVTEWFERTGLA